MSSISTSRLALVLSAGALALATVALCRPRRYPVHPGWKGQAVAGSIGGAASDSRRDQLRGVVRDAHPDAFTPVLSLQAKPGEPS